VPNFKLERLCLAKKILKGSSFSTRQRASPKEFPSTHRYGHLCYLAHARAKCKYAYYQGQVRIFLEQIAKLYSMGETYRRKKFTTDEIYRRRNSWETTGIIEK
jgi:hypothetical protein